MNAMVIQDARIEAAKALEAGQKLAARAHKARHRAQNLPDDLDGAELGSLLANPAAFWAGAATCAADGDDATVGAMALANKVAAARLTVGDLDFVRQSLIGQAGWLGVLAMKMASKAEVAGRNDVVPFLKLALQAQRQAAQALCSAAALDRLGGEVDVDGDPR